MHFASGPTRTMWVMGFFWTPLGGQPPETGSSQMNTPSKETADRMRRQIVARGDRRVSAALGMSRYAVIRVAAQLPVIESVLYTAESRLASLEDSELEAA